MALVIRLSKTGRKGEAKYRIVVKEQRSRRDGRPVDTIGWFEKKVGKVMSKIDSEKYKYWILRGAKPTTTVARIIKG